MNVNRMEDVAIDHCINKYPILGCANLRVVCSSTLAEVQMPIEEEREVIVSKHRPHSDSADAHSCILYGVLLVTKGVNLIQVIESDSVYLINF